MTYPFGLDVSSYQKQMDWQRAIDTGAQFAFVKATEGSAWVDPTFAYNWSELRRLKIPHGAYHFYRAAQGISQIEQFVDVVQPAPDELLVLDVESTGGLDKFQLTLNVKDAVEYIRQATGSYPILYSRASWLNANLIVSHLPKLDYWLAQYRWALPYPMFTEPYPSDKITIPNGVSREQVKFHQSSERGNGRRRGAQSYYIDLDTFIGTEDGLAAYFGGTSETQPEPPPPSETVLYQARVIADALNVRSTPEIADNKVDLLMNGAVVDVYETVER